MGRAVADVAGRLELNGLGVAAFVVDFVDHLTHLEGGLRIDGRGFERRMFLSGRGWGFGRE